MTHPSSKVLVGTKFVSSNSNHIAKSVFNCNWNDSDQKRLANFEHKKTFIVQICEIDNHSQQRINDGYLMI